MKKYVIFFCAFLVLVSFAVNLAFALSRADNKHTPAVRADFRHLYERLALLEAKLKQIQRALGDTALPKPIINVRAASLLNLYSEAQSLFEKESRLSYQVTHKRAAKPKLFSKKISTKDILLIINLSIRQINFVGRALGVPRLDKSSQEIPPSVDAADLINKILKINQIINSVLYCRYSPSDPFSQITLAIFYMQDIIQHLSSKMHLVETPSFVPNITPPQVYQKLLLSLDRFAVLEKKIGHQVMRLKLYPENLAEASPGDVYDLASLIVSEVISLDKNLRGEKIKFNAYYPGFKVPSQVYQRVLFFIKYINLAIAILNKSEQNIKVGNFLEGEHASSKKR